MIAGAGPMPPMPSAASAGNAAASADNGTSSRPNSAIDGIVCSRFRHREQRPLPVRPARRRDRRAETPISDGRPDRGGDQHDVADQRGGEDRSGASGIRGRATARRTARRRAIRANPPAIAADHREALAGTGAGALQRIDERQRGGAEQDPERGAERNPRQARRSGRERRRGLPGRASTSEQQRAGHRAAARCSARLRRRQRCGEEQPAPATIAALSEYRRPRTARSAAPTAAGSAQC